MSPYSPMARRVSGALAETFQTPMSIFCAKLISDR
jgi:hypothetical protein